MVGLSPAWVVVCSCEILEVLNDIKSVTEEDVVVDIYLAFCWLIGVKRSEISLDNCDCSLRCSLKEVVVDLLNSSVSLCSLSEIGFWEIFDQLIFFVPISDTSWVQTIEGVDYIGYSSLVADLILFPFLERGPVMHL